MPTPRCSYGATYIDDRIVVVGGEELTMVLNVVEIYDIADGKWSTGPPCRPRVTPRWWRRLAIRSTASAAQTGRPKGPVATVDALDFK